MTEKLEIDFPKARVCAIVDFAIAGVHCIYFFTAAQERNYLETISTCREKEFRSATLVTLLFDPTNIVLK